LHHRVCARDLRFGEQHLRVPGGGDRPRVLERERLRAGRRAGRARGGEKRGEDRRAEIHETGLASTSSSSNSPTEPGGGASKKTTMQRIAAPGATFAFARPSPLS